MSKQSWYWAEGMRPSGRISLFAGRVWAIAKAERGEWEIRTDRDPHRAWQSLHLRERFGFFFQRPAVDTSADTYTSSSDAYTSSSDTQTSSNHIRANPSRRGQIKQRFAHGGTKRHRDLAVVRRRGGLAGGFRV